MWVFSNVSNTLAYFLQHQKHLGGIRTQDLLFLSHHVFRVINFIIFYRSFLENLFANNQKHTCLKSAFPEVVFKLKKIEMLFFRGFLYSKRDWIAKITTTKNIFEEN
jgi:hypothetical protein